jgi:predicted dienelactone hydrolase
MTSAIGKLGRLSLILVALLMACAQPPAAAPVGLSFASYVDPQRPSWNSSGPRPIDVTFWYPARPGSVEQEWRVAFFLGGMSAPDAPLPDTPRRFPLVLLSHGTGGSSVSIGWLAHALAAHGYIVASVNHHGNTAAEAQYLPQGFALWWERARDLSVLLDRIAGHPSLGDRIDMSRIGVAGFSLGGYTALLLAGARTDRALWTAFCASHAVDPNCMLPQESPFGMGELIRTIEADPHARQSIGRAGDSYRDERIRAAFVLAPVQAPALDPASLSQIRIPVAITVGDEDRQAPPEVNAVAIARQLPGARLERIPGGTHYMFLTRCTPFGKVVAHSICTDPFAIDREQVQRSVGSGAVQFFDTALGVGAGSR